MRRLAAAAFAVALVVAVSSAALAIAQWPRTRQPEPSAPGTLHGSSSIIGPIHAADAHGVTIVSADPRSVPKRVEPQHIAIPDLDISLNVTPLGLNASGGMDLPGNAHLAAWYRYGAVPGNDGGAALIAAHVGDANGLGPFASLGYAKAGTAVTVSLSDGTKEKFVIVDVARVSKRNIDVAKTLADARGMLVLVTCGGRWNPKAGHYEDNVLAWALPLDISWSAQR